ncbi:MAG: protein kinase [Planctomycetota bacterium]
MNHEPTRPHDVTQPFEKTQPIHEDELVLYRCTCGTELKIDANTGGICTECGAHVSTKMLRHDLAMTMTINLDQARIPDDDAQPTAGLGDTRSGNSGDDDPLHLVGRTMGHFELVEPLGRGGMGQVYRALDTSLQRYVAVKVLRSGIGSTTMSSTSSEQEIDALLQEAVAQARVTHPNIVTIYYVGKQDGDPFLAMELIDGEPLSKLIESETLTFSHVAPIAIQLVNALRFSYELDIIHGDIKPSNIMVQSNGLTKLSDFGMARRASDTESGRLGGTPNYIAPELLEGAQPSTRSDMYAIGVTLYEMTFGRLPVKLTGSSIDQWIDSHNQAEIEFPTPWPENYPESWRDLLSRLLAKKPEDRFDSYEELVTELEKRKPGSRVFARPIPRVFAALIDWFLIMIAVGIAAIGVAVLSPSGSGAPFSGVLLAGAEVAIISIYSLVVFFWRQSPGRSIFHLRVVNQYGLKPTGKAMVLRDLVRNSLLLFIFIDDALRIIDVTWIEITAVVLAVCVILFMCANTVFMLFYEKGRSIHDIIFKTRVVLDTRQ